MQTTSAVHRDIDSVAVLTLIFHSFKQHTSQKLNYIFYMPVELQVRRWHSDESAFKFQCPGEMPEKSVAETENKPQRLD